MSVCAWLVPELSTTEACAARAIHLLCRGLFSCVAMVHVRISDAWVQLCWLSGARAVCTAGTRFADVAAQAIDCRVCTAPDLKQKKNVSPKATSH